MAEVFDILFSKVNIVLTVFFLVLVIYWVFTMFTGIDFDTDFDVDIDMDADVDLEAEVNTMDAGSMSFEEVSNVEVDQNHVINKKRKRLKWWQVILIYFNFVGLPFMFTFTCWIFFWWISTVISTVITHTYNLSFGYVFFLAMIIPSLILTKLFTNPFKGFFKHFNKDGDEQVIFLGRKARLKARIYDDKMGLAELSIEGSPVTLYVKSMDGVVLDYNAEVMIVKQTKDHKIFYVQAYT